MLAGIATGSGSPDRDYEEDDAPVLWNVSTRDAYLSNSLVLGNPGSGKTMLMGYKLTEMPTKLPHLGVSRVKKVVIDSSKRCEAGTMFCPMDKEHPLYEKLIAQGRQPKGFLVEVLKPLSISEGEHDIRGRQPGVYDFDVECSRCTGTGQVFRRKEGKVEECPRCHGERVVHNSKPLVRPFCFRIDKLHLQEWFLLLGIGRNRGMKQLHERVLNAEIERKRLETDTMAEFAAVAAEVSTDNRSLQGLQDAYDSLHETGLVLPHSWFGKETPWLDMGSILEDTDRISVFHLPYSAINPARQANVVTIVLRQLSRAKNFESGRIAHPIFVGMPEIANYTKKLVDKDEADYLNPLKRTVLQLFREGMGDGISVTSDTQFLAGKEAPDPMVLESAVGLYIFALNKAAIKDLLSKRSLQNRWAFDDEAIGKLRAKQGRFIAINPQSLYAERRSGAIPSYFYPRVKLGRNLSEFTFYDLFEKKLYPPSKNPERYFDPEDFYKVSDAILAEGRRRGDEMLRALEKEDEKDSDDDDQQDLEMGKLFKERLALIVGAFPDEQEFAQLYTRDVAEALKATFNGDKNLVAQANTFCREAAKHKANRGAVRPLVAQSKDGQKSVWFFNLNSCRNLLEGKPLDEKRA